MILDLDLVITVTIDPLIMALSLHLAVIFDLDIVIPVIIDPPDHGLVITISGDP